MRIIVTQGDCNGIGIEAFVKAVKLLNNDNTYDNIDFTICTNPITLWKYLKGIDKSNNFDLNSFYIDNRNIEIIECNTYADINFGLVKSDSGKLAGESIELALNEYDTGNYSALLTLPISKEAIKSAGYDFPGHTEMIGKHYAVDTPLMILCTDNVRVALVTIHEPLSLVPDLITETLILNRLLQFSNSLINDFGICKPRIAVLGLNPHAGENGKIGTEEKDIINGSISKFEYAYGPFPADGFFAHGDYKNYDGILAMYHDQGLIPLKMLAGGAGVNFTAGLPIIRTSPDHGTAFAIAGKGVAAPESTLNAIKMAVLIDKYRKQVII